MHSQIVEHLRSCADKGRFPHSLLFTEREGYGAIALVLEVLKYLFCREGGNGENGLEAEQTCKKIERLVHPDIHFVFPVNTSTLVGKEKRPEVEEFYPLWRELVAENPYFSEQELYERLGIENKQGTIGVAEANFILRKSMLSPYEGDKRAFVVLFPERMNQEASNKLLKSVEEPLPGTYFFFISQNPHRIIPTIVSRCSLVEVSPLPAEELAEALSKKSGIEREEALYWAECAGGSYGKALAMIKGGGNAARNLELFHRMLSLAKQKDLPALIVLSDELAAMAKEAQKQFCRDALEIVRKLFMLSCGVEKLAHISPREREEYGSMAPLLSKEFFERSAALFNSSIELLESNVNSKFIFCDMCNRFYFFV